MDRNLQYIAVIDGTVEQNLKQYGFSTRICTLLKRELGLVTVGGKPIFVVDDVHKGDVIDIILKQEIPKSIPKYDYPIEIVYSDIDVAVINKPSGLATISTTAHYDKSLMNVLANIWGDFVFHPVNRLDAGTSGLMVVARNNLSHSLLSTSIAEDEFGKAVERNYYCIVKGNIVGTGVIDEPIGFIDKSSYRREVTADGKKAVTYYEVIEMIGEYKLVKVRLGTGRTHQIRVHMNHLGCPLVGDSLYGGDTTIMERPALHSYSISFTHPITRNEMSFVRDMPQDMAQLLRGK